jgi:WbqC-like protein
MPLEMVVALHQPNFFPWLGYFDKLVRADAFVLLDNVQFSKTGGTWSNRVRLLAGDVPGWVTLPVIRAYSGVRLVREMQIDNRQPWRRKFLQTLRTDYARAKHFSAVFPEVARLVENDTDSLVDFNRHAITELCRLMEIDTNKVVLGSSLSVGGHATDLLVSTVRAVGGSTYLCGGGAEGYLEEEKFERAGLRLIHQHFLHPIYPQGANDAFVPGLSCIDALMHCGFRGVRALLGGVPS